MDKEYKFGRIFFILKREDEGFGLGKDPTGYVKIEVQEGKGKLFSHIENINDKQGKAVFKLYLIKCTKDQFRPVCVGELPISGGKGELSWRFDASNVDSTGISIDKFNIIAVMSDEVQKRNSFPLVAYKGKVEVPWKDKFKEALYSNSLYGYQSNVNNSGITKDNQAKESQDIENKPIDNNQAQDTKIENKPLDNKQVQDTKIENKSIDNKKAQDAKIEYNLTENQQAQDIKIENKPIEGPQSQYIQPENIEGDNKNINAKDVKDNFDSNLDEYEENIYVQVDENKPEDINAEFINKKNNENNNGPCNQVYGCTNCFNNEFNKFNYETVNNCVDINKLKELFNKNFEVANPFKNGCRIYKWWEVNNPVVLNNIFYQCNLKNPFLFNPKVLFAYYKHKNLIVGICNDISNDREYVVLGVPSNYSVEQRPLGMFCRWAQEEGVEPKNGAFGYWLVYIDANSGKIVG
ncbi:MAG TPA: hypothetical protein PK566_04590 [Pseudobacteroides sp.]|mgnify:CR=1 FL=1|nr:hypothetical protein [Pseudobacteroides sp.]